MKALVLGFGLVLGLQAQASNFGAPVVVSVDIESSRQQVDMNGGEYAVLRVEKKKALVTAEVTDSSLAHCKVLAIHQSPETVIADVIVAFEYENDGGYNSCDLKIKSGSKVYNVELGTAAGE